MSVFYTAHGDDGYTGLLGEGRVAKYHIQPIAYGEVDEASAALGMARALAQAPHTAEILIEVQRHLYRMMAELAATPETASKFRVITGDHVNWLEIQIEMIAQYVEVPKEFILPGDCVSGAALSVARTVVRRAERTVVHLQHEGLLDNAEAIRYLNRLSSLCFILEIHEVQYTKGIAPTLAKGNK